MGGSLQMLRSRRDFAALQASRTTRRHPLVTIRFRRNGLDATRIGLATGKALGGAVARNRVRRRLREILRRCSLAAGWDVLVIAGSPSAGADYPQLRDALEGLLRNARLVSESTDR